MKYDASEAPAKQPPSHQLPHHVRRKLRVVHGQLAQPWHVESLWNHWNFVNDHSRLSPRTHQLVRASQDRHHAFPTVFSPKSWSDATMFGHRSPPFVWRMKLPMWLMMARLVLTLRRTAASKESSRAFPLVSSSAHSLPAAVTRSASSNWACSALDKCALHHQVDASLFPNVSDRFAATRQRAVVVPPSTTAGMDSRLGAQLRSPR